VLVKAGSFTLPSSISPDSRFLVYEKDAVSATGGDIFVVDMTGDRTPKPLLATPADEGLAKLDPSGRFLAYTSNESGRLEVYVTAFPLSGGKWQVSQNGGTEPRWRGDTKELFFFDPDNRLQAAPVSADGPNFQSGTPVSLFQSRSMGARTLWRYDVTRDGQRFLVNTPLQDDTLSSLTLQLNWPELLGKK
ncbi:MAG: hypothetical protein L0170_05320, partial [Acidobacteria bacterium]|nr:hypothetical protein [Acidobacteriota bacterium]